MSPIYTPGKLTLAKTYVGIDDPDAQAYIAAVEAADETASPGIGALETATKVAIHSFVKGCKNDGIWPALKASCILAGARTKEGAIVPLANASASAPTLNGTAGDWNYNRETGLAGNGTNNYINSGRNNNADLQNLAHISVYLSSALGDVTAAIGSQSGTGSYILRESTTMAMRLNNTSVSNVGSGTATGAMGVSRNSPTQLIRRINSATFSISSNSTGLTNQNYFVCCRNLNGSANSFTSARIAFYSIGEYLDLEKLDARVTQLINVDLPAAIP